MKKLSLVLSLLFVFGLPIFGQTGDFDFPAAESYLGIFANRQLRLAKKLNLNTEQRLRLDEINNLYVTKAAALKTDKTLDRPDRRQQSKILRAEREAQFVKMLDPTQLAIWEQSKQARRNFRKRPR
ncbi:MAG: hypothetical protein RLZZ628_1813 [Bacteroidota bacterium]|jgi:hypothetical protein